MNKLRTYLPSRLFWLAFGAGLGVFSIAHSAGTHAISDALGGIGLIFLGVNWFLAPQVLGKPVMTPNESTRVAAVGPPSLHRILSFIGLCALFMGFAFRFLFES